MRMPMAQSYHTGSGQRSDNCLSPALCGLVRCTHSGRLNPGPLPCRDDTSAQYPELAGYVLGDRNCLYPDRPPICHCPTQSQR